MSRFLIVFGLAVLFTFDPLPAWMVVLPWIVSIGGSLIYLWTWGALWVTIRQVQFITEDVR